MSPPERPPSGSSRGRSRPRTPDRTPDRTSERATGSRHVDKARTRRALLDGALDLLADRSLDNVGIREVTRSAGVTPAAFYRHFDRVDDLGVVLVAEAFSTLRQLMAADDIAQRSVGALVRHIHDHRLHYRFLVREQYSALPDVRVAIRTEIRLFSTELATDLARLPVVNDWPVRDLVMLADLIVDLMVRTAQRILEAIDEAPEREPVLIDETVRQLRYLTLAGADPAAGGPLEPTDPSQPNQPNRPAAPSKRRTGGPDEPDEPGQAETGSRWKTRRLRPLTRT